MKPFSGTLAIALILILSACSLNAQNANSKSKSNKSSMQTMPYTALYSSQFEIGDSKFSSIVLNAWKAYDDNSFDQAKMDYIADTIHATMGNGMAVNGKDSLLNAIRSYRAALSAAKSEVVAYMSVKSIDKHDNLLMIWGTETDTKPDGSTEKVDLHEVWGFNKDGKVDFFKQFMASVPK